MTKRKAKPAAPPEVRSSVELCTVEQAFRPLSLPARHRRSISPTEMMGMATPFACVQKLKSDIGTLPFRVYKRTSKGREIARSHPSYRLVNQKPNPRESAEVFWKRFLENFWVFGAGLARIYREKMRPVRLEILQPSTIQPVVDRNSGERKWKLQGESALLDDWEILYVPYDVKCDDTWVSLLQKQMGTFVRGYHIDQLLSNWYAKGTSKRTYLSSETERIQPKEAENTRNTFREFQEGTENAGNVLILTNGLKPGEFGQTPEELGLETERQRSKTEICSVFGMPVTALGESATYQNNLTDSSEYVSKTIRPVCRLVEAELLEKLLLESEKAEYYFGIDTEALREGDFRAQDESFKTAILSGFMTPDEVREKKDLPPMGGIAAELLIPANMIPQSQVGIAPPPPPQGRAAETAHSLDVRITAPRRRRKEVPPAALETAPIAHKADELRSHEEPQSVEVAALATPPVAHEDAPTDLAQVVEEQSAAQVEQAAPIASEERSQPLPEVDPPADALNRSQPLPSDAETPPETDLPRAAEELRSLWEDSRTYEEIFAWAETRFATDPAALNQVGEAVFGGGSIKALITKWTKPNAN